MNKLKFVLPILLLAILVFIGGSCGDENGEGGEEGQVDQGKKSETSGTASGALCVPDLSDYEPFPEMVEYCNVAAVKLKDFNFSFGNADCCARFFTKITQVRYEDCLRNGSWEGTPVDDCSERFWEDRQFLLDCANGKEPEDRACF